MKYFYTHRYFSCIFVTQARSPSHPLFVPQISVMGFVNASLERGYDLEDMWMENVETYWVDR